MEHIGQQGHEILVKTTVRVVGGLASSHKKSCREIDWLSPVVPHG